MDIPRLGLRRCASANRARPPDPLYFFFCGSAGGGAARGGSWATAFASPVTFPKYSGIWTPPMSRIICSIGGSEPARPARKPAVAPLPPFAPFAPPSQTTILSNLMLRDRLRRGLGEVVEVLEHQHLEGRLRAAAAPRRSRAKPSPFFGQDLVLAARLGLELRRRSPSPRPRPRCGASRPRPRRRRSRCAFCAFAGATELGASSPPRSSPPAPARRCACASYCASSTSASATRRLVSPRW